MNVTLTLALFIAAWALLDYLKPQFVANLEDNILSFLLAIITLVSFGQVVARYGFNTGWSAALEFNMLAFSWLILFGMSYGIRTRLHLGVDILLQKVGPQTAKVLGIVGGLLGAFYALIILDGAVLSIVGVDKDGGAITYFAKMYKVGIGVEEMKYPAFVQEMFGLKRPHVQRWVVLLILPISLGLLAYRCLQASWHIYTGQRGSLIAGHEAESLVEENRGALKD